MENQQHQGWVILGAAFSLSLLSVIPLSLSAAGSMAMTCRGLTGSKSLACLAGSDGALPPGERGREETPGLQHPMPEKSSPLRLSLN